jgi:hypothetical protein
MAAVPRSTQRVPVTIGLLVLFIVPEFFYFAGIPA